MTAKEYMKQHKDFLEGLTENKRKQMLFVRNFLFPNHLPILICPNPYRRNLTPWKAAFLRSYPWRKK